ncbi:MAG: phosphoribosylpyrophosphate synthetase [Candidatus Rokuibacteriota bacterium]|nr:MAG: phosphoribosylpyrophosphate synthetase [Candidatus Rokubacteria bacterium]
MEDTLTHVVDELTRRGYKEHFRVADGRLHAIGTGQRFAPEGVVIRGYYRFEGVSDPDDMAIVYAIETRSGVRGILVDAFGVYSDPTIGAALQHVPMLGKSAA